MMTMMMMIMMMMVRITVEFVVFISVGHLFHAFTIANIYTNHLLKVSYNMVYLNKAVLRV